MTRNKQIIIIFVIIVTVFLIFIYQKNKQKDIANEVKVTTLSNMIKITSPAFFNKELIPIKYTCMGMSINPPLLIDDIPDKTKSLALIVDDPDAVVGTFTHWVMWNIDPKIKLIGENNIPSGAIIGTSDSGRSKYVAPCPPSGIHRYFFKIYALDININLSSNSNKEELIGAMENHIIDSDELIGLYSK